MFKNITLITALLFASLAQAQKEISPRRIDLLAYNAQGYLSFYTQKQKDKFLELEFDYQEDEKADYDNMDVYNLILNYYNDDNLKSLKEIEEADNKIIYPKDIRHTTLRDFVGKTFKTLPPVYDKDTHTIIKILNPRLALMWDIDKEEEEEDYSYQRREYFALRPISLGKGRYIYLLSDDSRIEAFIVPLKGKTLFLNTTDTAVLTATERFPSSYKEDFIGYDPEESMLLRPKGRRYELINIYNEKVIPGKYDTIYYNEYGIVGIRGNKFELYDSYLQKKKFKGMRSVYLYREGIEMLDKQGAGYYSMNGERIEKFPRISYSLCGTVYESRYSLKEDPDRTEYPYYMLYRFGGFASEFEAEKRHYLSDRSPEETLSFVNGSSHIVWDGNDYVVNSIYPYPQFIRVQRGNKYGLFEYTYQKELDDTSYTTGAEETESDETYLHRRTLRKYPSVHITGKELLPIDFDNIQQHKDGLIYLYKDNKIGIYPRQKQTVYEKIEPQTHSFYRIVKNGKEGYLDIRTMKEYYK